MPLLTVLLQVQYLLLKLVELAHNRGNFEQDRFLALLTILQITERLVLKESVDKQPLNLFELREEISEFFVVVLLDAMHLLTHRAQLRDLIFDLVLKLTNFTAQVLHTELLKHDDLVITVLAQQALEADGAQVVLAEGFNVLSLVDLALCH